ncbi:MAG TPA: hypothetical protein VGP82_13835 [Ktedonobacterales bacterium]|nr:hypothetical protein [Ktedonobacterales bacterium]
MLRFELGNSDRPRGHALMYARLSGSPERIVATYCIVLPISFSLGKYLPPMLAGQLPMEALRDETTGNAMPIPPMFEDVSSVPYLHQLAERRGDDLCDMGTLLITDDNQRLAFAAEGCMEYAELYAAYQQREPVTEESAGSDESPLDDVDVEDVAASLLPERDRLGEIARLISQARYALETGDQRQLDEVTTSLHRLARSLPEKYRADLLVESALRRDTPGPRLAELYLQRAYKLLDENYTDIPPIEQEIRDLRQHDHPNGGAGAEQIL